MEVYITLTIIIVLLILWYHKRKKQMSLFSRLNIPGPKPHLITGNLTEFIEKGPGECQIQWTKKYGNILGYYLGAKPIIMVSDLELLKTVMVKHFHHFIDREKLLADASVPDKRGLASVSFADGARWKHLRSILTPAFSTHKLKQMIPLIDDAIKIFMEKLKDKNDEEFDIFPMFHKLTIDIIGRTAFGAIRNTQNNPNDAFVQQINYIISQGVSSGSIWTALCFPEVEPLLVVLRHMYDVIRGFVNLPSFALFFKSLNEVIEKRRLKKSAQQDLLQLMIDANLSAEELENVTEEQLTADMNTNVEIKAQDRKSSSKLRFMTNDEIMGNALVIMVAGFETTGTTLSFIIHSLVNHPEVQDEIREEIEAVLETEELSYSALPKMHRLEEVISECLRLHPPVVTFTTRLSDTEFTHNNITIPKGAAFQVPLWYLHRSEDFWENPDNFDPGRFSVENKREINPFVYQPFGVGPRNCIGMRLAHVLMKLIMITLLRSFRFVPGSKTEMGSPKLTFNLFQVHPTNGVYVKVVPICSN